MKKYAERSGNDPISFPTEKRGEIKVCSNPNFVQDMVDLKPSSVFLFVFCFFIFCSSLRSLDKIPSLSLSSLKLHCKRLMLLKSELLEPK